MKKNVKHGPLLDNIKYAILNYLAEVPLEKSTQSDIQENLGIWRNQLMQAVDELVAEDKLEIIKVGAARLHRVKKHEITPQPPSEQPIN